MKLVKSLLATAVVAASFSAATQAGEVSTNIAVASDYVWRGVSQTGNGAAVSGGIDYADDSGFFAGTWVSNTSFGSAEMDLYLGYGGEAGDFGYGVTYNYYAYPSVDDANFGELLLDFSYNIVSFGLAYTVNSDVDEPSWFNEGDLHYYVGAGFDLGNDWSLGLTYGFYDFDADGTALLDEAGEIDGYIESYGYFQVDLGKSYGDWGDFGLSATMADSEVNTLAGSDTGDNPVVWVSWSKGF